MWQLGELRNCGSIPSRGRRLLPSLEYTYVLWSPPRLFFYEWWEIFPKSKVDRT